MKMVERMAEREAGILEWLESNAPFVFADQKHLDEHSPEQAYWHHGYLMALRDVSAAIKEAESE